MTRLATASRVSCGRTSVAGTINGTPFQATLDPDSQLSHWLKVSLELQEAPTTSAAAKATWEDTTTIARLDWVHRIESAKQAKARKSRIDNARALLASGKKRVCCFDQSGYYSNSKSLRILEAKA